MATLNDQIRAQANRWTGGNEPTNAQALAALDAYGSLPIPAGMLMPEPDMTQRLKWLAIGYSKAGDKFAIATNAKHYRAKFPRPDLLWKWLDELTSTSDRYLLGSGEQPPIVIIDDKLERGEPNAIAHEVATAWQELQRARQDGAEPNAAINMSKGQYEAIKEALRKSRDKVKERAPDIVEALRPPSLRAVGIVIVLILVAAVAAGNVASNRR